MCRHHGLIVVFVTVSRHGQLQDHNVRIADVRLEVPAGISVFSLDRLGVDFKANDDFLPMASCHLPGALVGSLNDNA